MQQPKSQASQALALPRPPFHRTAKKRVRIIKKVRIAGGLWKFISLDRIGSRYVWDKRTGYYFLEWWEGKKRRRQLAGQTPSQAIEAQRRKRNELVGELLSQGKTPPGIAEGTASEIADAIPMFLEHVKAHSPDKPLTVRRYQEVLGHFERLLGKKKYVEAITRADIDDYKIRRSEESNGRHDLPPKPRTINFEVSTLRTFFYYLINERGVPMVNPCARFKPLKDEKEKARRKPPTYLQAELDRLFAACDSREKTAFATLLLTGLREQELCYLTWKDVDLKRATIQVSGEGKEGFSPKDLRGARGPHPTGSGGASEKAAA